MVGEKGSVEYTSFAEAYESVKKERLKNTFNMAKREFSAGGIVFRKKDTGFQILLIKDSYGHWSWPKGNINKNESSQEAALREIREEVGLRKVKILAKVGKNNYFYRLKGDLIFKTVFFFLAEDESRERLKAQLSEITLARWFDPQTALRNVDYKGAKEMLNKAIKMYKTEKKC